MRVLVLVLAQQLGSRREIGRREENWWQRIRACAGKTVESKYGTATDNGTVTGHDENGSVVADVITVTPLFKTYTPMAIICSLRMYAWEPGVDTGKMQGL